MPFIFMGALISIGSAIGIVFGIFRKPKEDLTVSSSGAKRAFAILAYMLLLGLGLLITGLMNNEEAGIGVLFIGLSLFCFGLLLFRVLLLKNCQGVVNAVCLRYDCVYAGGKGPAKYAVVWEYTLFGKVFRCRDLVSFTHKKIQNLFMLGATYPVFVHTKDPTVVVSDNRVKFFDVVSLALPSIMMAIGFYLFCILKIVEL